MSPQTQIATTQARSEHVRMVLCDSLEKVFPDAEPREFTADTPAVVYAGSRTAVQVALLVTAAEPGQTVVRPEVSVQSPDGVSALVQQVDLVPVSLPAPADADPNEYLRLAPGLYPDLLRPLEGRPDLTTGSWHALWITLEAAPDASTARTSTQITVRMEDGTELSVSAPLLVVGSALGELPLVNTHWFHVDGLLHQYSLEPFSERYWEVIEAFLGAAADMSVNSVLTPVWTPPLDTEENTERTPTQLLRIIDDGKGTYRFETEHLDRWLEVARRVGITHLEVPHLFTQWGARATPSIWVQTPTGPEQRFGWDVPADDPSYRALLEQLLPFLITHLDEKWGRDKVIFHISDEPNEDNLPTYGAAHAAVADLLADVTVVDALSSYSFYDKGLVKVPVAAVDHAAPFLAGGVKDLWVYYCMGQTRGVSNRFIAQPSVRNRALGTQLAVNRAGGFLHWGFNFYNAQLSLHPINPFLDTCSAGAFYGGDPFMVYPGVGGVPVRSIRSEVFAEAMVDVRAAALLRETIGEERADAILRRDWAVGYDLPVIEADEVRGLAHEVAEAIIG